MEESMGNNKKKILDTKTLLKMKIDLEKIYMKVKMKYLKMQKNRLNQQKI